MCSRVISADVTWCWRNNMQIFTSVILYMNIIFVAQWLLGGNSEIWNCSDVYARRQKLCKPESIFRQTCQLFLPQKYDVISQLCHSYSKGPFCMTWLIYSIWFTGVLRKEDRTVNTNTLFANFQPCILYEENDDNNITFVLVLALLLH